MSGDDHKQLANLLSKCAHSDEQAFKEVYSLTSAALYAVLVRALGMNATAEQALQDTFVKVWLKAVEFPTQTGQPMAWLTSIARSHASGVLRLHRLRSESAVKTPAAKPLCNELTQIKFLDKGDDAQALETCLNQLDALSLDCIVRAYAEGLSHKELGEIHDTSIAGVKGWIHNGLLSLKGCVDGRAR